ncbi:hypothetical protein SAMN05421810_10182 [Amycolatopsis arida]|uniref:Uncharacterized protein n=1 Tax=Amycolatopsis arida TaxID=587909 RepID=A0A1I5KBW8_9PSEU|nr:hypothetical protein CLV69_10280 [Amycolatopsis arida]SFO82530.1 hypothetical protein SAMN05421810_10182 [Amycolatopsis arida]
MKFVSQHYPGLIVRDIGVRFSDGVADVDPKTAAELRKLPTELGVREVGGGAARDEPAKPRRGRAE